jgi:anthranilate synthase/aminodeoxychorismate synthase-like glutamine amidotransferase
MEDIMLVMIDNYDSFTYNIVQYLGELGAQAKVFRNDKVTLREIQDLSPDRIVISPGPGDPAVDGGISNEVIREMGPEIPILGVCLGHQCIGQVYGGKISRAERLMHGKTSSVYHNGKGLYTGVPSPFNATRYHSLIVEDPVPEVLEVTAFTRDGEIMGLKHKVHPVFGVQFHPESILTEHGKRILLNFLEGR